MSVSAIMDKKNKAPMVIMVNQEWHCSHQVAFADLEVAGLLSLVSHKLPVVDAFVAPSASHYLLCGRPKY